MKKFLLLLLPIFFISYVIYSDTDNKHIFYLDNPTNKNIEITLDGKLYKLKSKTYEVLNLKTGEHIAELSDGTKVYFKFLLTLREVLSIQVEHLILLMIRFVTKVQE